MIDIYGIGLMGTRRERGIVLYGSRTARGDVRLVRIQIPYYGPDKIRRVIGAKLRAQFLKCQL